MGVILLIAALGAVALAAYAILSNGGIQDILNTPEIPTTPDVPEVPEMPEVPENPIESPATEAPAEEPPIDEPANGQAPEPEGETATRSESLESERSFVDDGLRNSIIKLYFAKEAWVESDEQAGQTTGDEGYAIVSDSFSVDNDTEADDISKKIKISIDAKIKSDKRYVKIETIKEQIQVGASFTKAEDSPLQFMTHKLKPEYEKIESAPLEDTVFVFAKTASLDGEQITFNIKEQKPLLLDEEDQPLNVVLVEGEGENETEGEEATELKATVEDGQAAVKIMLKPKDEEHEDGSTPNLDEWRRRIRGLEEDGAFTYIADSPFRIESEAELRSIAQTIVRRSRDKGLDPDLTIFAEDIIEMLRPQGHPQRYGQTYYTYIAGIPTYKLIDDEHEEYTYTFVNEDGTSLGHPGFDQKRRFAGIIKENIEQGRKVDQPNPGDNPRLTAGVYLKEDDIVVAFDKLFYDQGETICFPSYKKRKPLLWLYAEGGGHDKEDLNQSGTDADESYFEIGKKCVCKEYDLIWGNKVSCAFRKKIIEICSELWGEERKIEMANALMAVINKETAGSFKAHQIMGRNISEIPPPSQLTKDSFWLNSRRNASRAVGLIQFTQIALELIGDFTSGSGFDKLHEVKLEYAQMGEVNQLDKVKKYFASLSNYSKENNTPEDMYLLVFGPAAVGQNDDFILYTSPSRSYSQNESVDTIDGNNDGKIQRNEILTRYYDSVEEGKRNKETRFSCSLENNNGIWRNPLDNPQITIYTYGGNKRPWRSAFGRVRTDLPGSDNGARPHHGLDLFAKVGTSLYSCLPGTVVSTNPGTGYGKGLVIKVDSEFIDDFKNQRRNYSPYYVKSIRNYNNDEYDIDDYGDFDEYIGIIDSDEVYLMYAHLSVVSVISGERITPQEYKTKVIGKTGKTGASNTKGPHLHFEIRSAQNPIGYTQRYNPAFYVNYKNETQLSSEERSIQDNEAN